MRAAPACGREALPFFAIFMRNVFAIECAISSWMANTSAIERS